ncbi:MAG: hypothetical protein RLN99_18080, partial [Kiloniellaceae bacterium]
MNMSEDLFREGTVPDESLHGATGLPADQEAARETGGEADPIVVGQAGEAIVVDRPAPGQTVEIQTAPGQTYVLNFPPADAQVLVQGDNFVLAFDDNGDGTPDSQIVFLDLASVVEAGDAPTFQIAGNDIGADVLLGQALALAGQGEAPLDEVAAGEDAVGGGTSAYSDNLGDIIDLLNAEDVIPPTELQFDLIDIDDEILLEDEDLALAEDTPPEADSVLTQAIQADGGEGEGGGIPSELEDALAELVGGEGGSPDLVFFKQLTVDGDIGDDDSGEIADFGGSDAETALEDLVFTLQSNPTYGQLILVSGGTASFLAPGDTFTSADTVWWIATEDQVSAFLEENELQFLPNVEFDYSVTDEAGNVATAPVVITIPREVLPPEVTLDFYGGNDCIEEDSSLGDFGNEVTVTVVPDGDDLLTEIVLSGFQPDWEYDLTDLDTDGAGTGVVVTDNIAGDGTVTITFSPGGNGTYTGSFDVQPPADSDVDHPTITATATVADPADPGLTASGDGTLDIPVDANADGGEGSSGDDGDGIHLSVALSVADSAGGENTTFQVGETGTVTVSATFDDFQDGSETHTVTVTAPEGFTIGEVVGDLPAGVSVQSNDGTTLVLLVDSQDGDGLDGVGTLEVTFEVTNVDASDGEASFTAEARAEETSTGDVECDPSDGDNVATVTTDATATVASITPPEVTLDFYGGNDCIEEDSSLGDFGNEVTVTDVPDGDDLLTEIVLSGFQPDWEYDLTGLDTDGLGDGVVITDNIAGDGTVTITFSPGSSGSYNGSFDVQPPADSDVDHPTITATATVADPADPSLTASGDGSLDIHVDANADGGEGSAGDDFDGVHLSVTLAVADSVGDEGATFQVGETGTVTVSATFD